MHIVEQYFVFKGSGTPGPGPEPGDVRLSAVSQKEQTPAMRFHLEETFQPVMFLEAGC